MTATIYYLPPNSTPMRRWIERMNQRRFAIEMESRDRLLAMRATFRDPTALAMINRRIAEIEARYPSLTR